MSKILTLAVTLGAVFLSGCAGNFTYAKKQGVFPVSADVYEVFREDHRGIFGSEESLQREVIEEADDFAKRKQMQAMPIEAKQHKVGTMGDWGWAYYKFKLVPPSNASGNRFAEIKFVGDARLSNNFLDTKDMATQPSSYDELLKLDELRKKGILTEEEFLTQKKRLLESR